MTCYHPIKAFKLRHWVGEDSKIPKIVFNAESPSYIGNVFYMPIELPCGKCIGCRLEYAREWACRCVHEASLYKHNFFLTLTYDDQHLKWTSDGEQTLFKKDFQDFMKRLRKYFYDRDKDNKIRYFYCGEYGGQTHRPHYHAILFNCPPFVDVQEIGHNYAKQPLYHSDILDSIWKNGRVILGTVTYDSCAYVARYVSKKSLCANFDFDEQFKKFDASNGENHVDGIVTDSPLPEYIGMSNRPGIGAGWFSKFGVTDCIPRDRIVLQTSSRTLQVKVPKYYTKLEKRLLGPFLGDRSPQRMEAAIKHKADHPEEYTIERLHTKESSTKLKMKRNCLRSKI